MTTYYVSSNIGNNDNAGTSESAPLASLRAALSATAHAPHAMGGWRLALRSRRLVL